MNLRSLACLFVLCLAASTCHGSVIVTVGDLSLAPGSSGLLPVYISTTDGQPLASTNFEFLITTAGPTRLEFTGSPDPSADPTFATANYIFAGNSGDVTFDIPLGTAQTTNVPNDTFFGGDLTADSSNVAGPFSNALIAYLPVTTSATLPPIAGDIFTVSLVPDADIDPDGISGFTGFADSSGSFAAFSSTVGTVTIVPEPATIVFSLTSALFLATARQYARHRRKRCCPRQQT